MPSIEGGGVEKNLFLVSNFLAKKLNKISLISISSKYKSKFNNNIKFITLKSKFWDNQNRRIKYILSIFLLLKELFLNKNNLVFAFQANIYCIIICKIFSVKIIVRSNSAPIGWSKNIVKRGIFKILLKKADKTMVNSYEFRNKLKSNFNVNSVCIYNPLNKREILKKSKIKVKKIFNRKKSLKILNIGRFVEQKDQMTLLRSLNRVKKKINFEAVLIGKGILKSKLKQFINDNNLSDNVKLIEFTANPFPYIKEADIFVLSSLFEGLPNVLLEALVLKKFIISSNCNTGPKEILLNGKGGLLFKVGDDLKLSKQIIYYHMNKKKCNLMLKKSISQLSRFDFKINLNKYLNLINSVN